MSPPMDSPKMTDMPIYLEALERNPFTGTMVLMTVDHYKELLAKSPVPPATSAPTTAGDWERTAFEQWIGGPPFRLAACRFGDGAYDGYVEIYWRTWLARAALASPPDATAAEGVPRNAKVIAELVRLAFSTMHHDCDHDDPKDEAAAHEKRILTERFAKVLRAPSPPAEPEAMAVVRELQAERERQKSVEGWAPEHDDWHVRNPLSTAAAAYALQSASHFANHTWANTYRYLAQQAWPFDDEFWKPTDPRRDLVKAGALIIAEIERIDRASGRALVSHAPAADK